MSSLFVFDLDCTITKREILPLIASIIGKEDLMQNLTDSAMLTGNNFEENFLMRLEILKDIPLEKIQKTVSDIEVFPKIAEFIKENKENCYVLTGNLDVYICDLIKKLGMENHCFSSITEIEDDKIKKIISVVNKAEILKNLKKENTKSICIGDGTNDIEMLKIADVGIAFSAVHKVCDELKKASTHHIDNENDLCELLALYQ